MTDHRLPAGAAHEAEDPNAWDYLPLACVPPGTSVTVHVTAVDCMGGIGRGWERKIMGEG